MDRERWGTFAVNDHLRRYLFVFDVLLYDRLVIPYPPKNERTRWKRRGWGPDRLDRCIEDLGDLVIKAPWGKYQQEVFKTRFDSAKAAEFDSGMLAEFKKNDQDPYYMTRMLLSKEFLPELPEGVLEPPWVVAAYPSANAYIGDYRKSMAMSKEERLETLGIVITHKFLAPKLSDKGSTKLSPKNSLKRVVKLATSADFREKRTKFYTLQEELIEKKIPDKKAIAQMEKYLEDYNDIVRDAVGDVYWKFAFTVIKIAVSIVAAKLVTPAIAAGGLVSLAKFVKFDRIPVIQAGECGGVAMLHDIRKTLKIRDN